MSLALRIALISLTFICWLGIQSCFAQLDSKVLGTWDYSTEIEVDDTIRILHYQFRFLGTDSVENIIFTEGDNETHILSGNLIEKGSNRFEFRREYQFIRDKSGTIVMEKALNSSMIGQIILTFEKVRKKSIVIQLYFLGSEDKFTQKLKRVKDGDF